MKGNIPLAKVLFALLWEKGLMLKGKGKIPNLSPFPLPLFPTYARSLMSSSPINPSIVITI
ncbi:hypothetical protein FACHB389_30140 [Nostoc calcicola FACHB-389]|nr:hypothetical protein FACHB389_30140 [Nostoc calcicola FACHB-389]